MDNWKFVIGSNNLYIVNEIGIVKSTDHSFVDKRGITQFFKGRILKQEILNGYCRVALSIDGKVMRKSVHRIVCETFIPNPLQKPFVNHKNGNRTDNRIENLEWCTHQENVLHSYKNGFQSKKGIKAAMCKLTEADVRSIFNSRMSAVELAELYPITPRTIRDIRNGISWNHITGLPSKRQKTYL